MHYSIFVKILVGDVKVKVNIITNYYTVTLELNAINQVFEFNIKFS